jgi:hypothetical protein
MPIKPPFFTEMDLVRGRQIVSSLTPLKRLPATTLRSSRGQSPKSARRVANKVGTWRRSTWKHMRPGRNDTQEMPVMSTTYGAAGSRLTGNIGVRFRSGPNARGYEPSCAT